MYCGIIWRSTWTKQAYANRSVHQPYTVRQPSWLYNCELRHLTLLSGMPYRASADATMLPVHCAGLSRSVVDGWWHLFVYKALRVLSRRNDATQSFARHPSLPSLHSTFPLSDVRLLPAVAICSQCEIINHLATGIFYRFLVSFFTNTC